MNQTNSILGAEEQPIVTPTSDEKTMAILSHILAIFFYFLAPLIIYLAKKDSPFVTAHAKESLNFQLTMLIAGIVSIFLMFVLIGFLLIFILGVLNLVLCIMATIKASDSKLYKYPFSIKFIK